MSSGQFWWGMTTGLVAGAVVGMSVAPSRREMKKDRPQGGQACQ